MKNKIFAVSALALALAACDDNDVTAGTNNVEGTVEIAGIATSGIPFIGTELSADVADANGLESSTVIAYQWMSDGTAIANATANSYVLTDAEDGTVITVSAIYTDNDGFDESIVSSETEVVTVAPVNIPATVTITGETFSGSVLTAEISDANGTEDISVTYVWSRDGVIDENITTETYTLLESDIGSVFTVQVTFTDNIDAEEDATSAETAVITAPLGDVTRVAEISDRINGDTGELRIDGFGTLPTGALRFRFSRDNLLSENFPASNVPDANGDVATPASFLGIFGTGSSSTSSQNALIDLRMDNGGVFSIRNADNDTVSQNIVIDETFADGEFTEVLVTWDATNASVADNIQPQVTVAIDGELITDAPFDSPAFESNRTDSSGANDPLQGLPNVVDGVATIQWRMGDNDEIVIGNFRIDDIVIYSDVAATTEVFSEDFEAIDIDTPLTSSVTLTGAAINDSTVNAVVTQFIEGEAAEDSPGSVAISGGTVVGSTLTAAVTDDNGVVSDAINYQWMRGGVDITGAEASTYTLVDADLGATITVTVDYTDVDGFDAVNVVSSATAAVTAPVVVDAQTVTGFAASITDTDGNGVDATFGDTTSGSDTGELRYDVGSFLLSGTLSFVMNNPGIVRDDGANGEVGIILFSDGTSTGDGDDLVDLDFENDGDVDFNTLQDSTGTTLATFSDAYVVGQDTFVEITWATDGASFPTATVTVNGVLIGSGINSSTLASVQQGFRNLSIQVNAGGTRTANAVLIDNISISGSTTADPTNIDFTFTENFEGIAVGTALDTATVFHPNSEDSTVVDTDAVVAP